MTKLRLYFKILIPSWLGRIYWWFQHRFNPRHRYHIVYTGLKPGYYDTDTRLLYSNFNLVCNYFEREAVDISWDRPKYQEVYKTLHEIHEYWRGGERAALEKTADEFHVIDCWEEAEKAEKQMHDRDRLYLHKMVDILDYLWS